MGFMLELLMNPDILEEKVFGRDGCVMWGVFG